MNETELRKNFKILQITKKRFPPAIRVVKEGISLFEAGYGSAVLAPGFPDQPERETWQGIEIFRVKGLSKRSFWQKLSGEAAFYCPAWHKAIRETIEVYKPDVLHVHDIWLGKSAFAARTNQKMVMDLHENMPAAVVQYGAGHSGLLKLFLQIFHTHSRIFALERKMLEQSDMVLGVVQEARDRVLREHLALNPAKVINVENLESKRFIADGSSGVPSFSKDHFSILYIGGFGPHRGIDTLIESMQYLKDSNVKVQLIGAVPSQYLDKLKAMIKSLNVGTHVQITGWVSQKDVLANIRQADVCCVPHHSNPHTDNTIPHKLFQYMIAKRPILVSSSGPLARSVQQAKAGLVFRAGDAKDCADKILQMVTKPGDCEKFAENGHRYVLEEKHNWEDESAPCLIKAYDELLGLKR